MPRHRLIVGIVAGAAALVLAMGGATLAAGPDQSAGSVSPLAATAGCGKAPSLTSGSHTISSGGQNRSYIIRIPDNYDRNHPYKLIFGFHWNGGTANDVDSGGTSGYLWSYYGVRALSNNQAIFVAPQGNGNGWANPNGQDLTFVDNMIATFEAGLCIDTTQLYSMGFSYGGGMTYAIACARATVFRAVVVYSGMNLRGCNGGTQPIAYLGIHGLRDGTVPISAGRSLRDQFVRNNGCTPQTPREPAQGSLTHIVTTYSGCSAGHPVVWAAFDGGHIAAPQDGAPGDSGPRPWTPALVWSFFTQFENTTPPTSAPPTSTPPTSAPPTSTPPTSAPPTSTPPTSTTPVPPWNGSCRVSATVNAWNTGLTETVTIANTGGTAIDGWSLVFTLPGGQTITNGWNATYSPTSGAVTARNVSYNAAIPAGGSVDFGFQATHTGNPAKPTSFTLNGATCSA